MKGKEKEGPAGSLVGVADFGRFLERLKSPERPAAVLFVGEYRFPSHSFDDSLVEEAVRAIEAAAEKTHSLLSYDGASPDLDLAALYHDLKNPGLFEGKRLLLVRRAEGLCHFAGRARKPNERTPFEEAVVRFERATKDGSALLVSLPTGTAAHPLAKDLLAAGGAVVVCARSEPGEASGFSFAAALVEGRGAEAVRVLSTIRREGLSLAPARRERDPRALYPVLFARLVEAARRAAVARRLLDGGASIREAGAAAGARAWPGSDLDRAARSRPASEHEDLLRRLRVLDVSVKTGREPDPFFGFERLASAVARERR